MLRFPGNREECVVMVLPCAAGSSMSGASGQNARSGFTALRMSQRSSSVSR